MLPALAGVVAFGAGLAFVTRTVRIPAPSAAPQSAPPPKLVLTDKTVVNRELAMLTDLEPLFLPTPWNTSILELPAQTGREPGSMGFTFPAKWTVSEQGGGVTLPEPVSVSPDPISVLRIGEAPNPMPEVGRADIELRTLPSRVALIEVRAARSGAMVFSEAVPPSVDTGGLNGDWIPLEFMVAIDRAGLVGAPQVTRSSGAEEVEVFFRGLLTKQLQLGARLPPGFYTVAVGP
jgi:hypothetical protein